MRLHVFVLEKHKRITYQIFTSSSTCCFELNDLCSNTSTLSYEVIHEVLPNILWRVSPATRPRSHPIGHVMSCTRA